jgi:phage terminase Nu1 subunit (DNA packaging protein)
MDTEITTARLAQLFDTTSKTIADLGKRDIIVKGGKRGSWKRDASISGYVKHLRAEAAARGGEAGQSARERLGQAQADLAEAKGGADTR